MKEQGLNDSVIGCVSEFYEKHVNTIISHMSVTGTVL